MRDYVNVKKPSSIKMWAKKNRAEIRFCAIIIALVLISMLGAA